MTNLQYLTRCFDAIQHNAELLGKQPARRRHDLASEILRELRNAKWYLSLHLKEADSNANHDERSAQRGMESRAAR